MYSGLQAAYLIFLPKAWNLSILKGKRCGGEAIEHRHRRRGMREKQGCSRRQYVSTGIIDQTGMLFGGSMGQNSQHETVLGGGEEREGSG